MLSLLIHAALGALTVWIFFRANDYLYRNDWPGSAPTFLEGLYYVLAVGSVLTDRYFPLWTIIDGPRRGLRWCWIYFVMSLFTSFGFAMGMYLAAQERQVRWNEVRA